VKHEWIEKSNNCTWWRRQSNHRWYQYIKVKLIYVHRQKI